jgi:hypothetical protein
MSHLGKTQFAIMMTVGPNDVAEADRIFASHGEWMKGHPREGDVALLEYTISTGPELSNPLDPSSEPTGKTIFLLSEFYESPAGIARHWQDAMASWPDLASVVELSGRDSVTLVTLHSGTAVQALW